MKKTLLPLSLSLVVVFLAGCANSNARKVSDKNVYLMQAATGLNIASGVSTSSKMMNVLSSSTSSGLSSVIAFNSAADRIG